MESRLRNAVTGEAGETSSGTTEEAQIHSNSMHTSTMEARFETVKKVGEDVKNKSPKIQKVMFLRDPQDFKKYHEPRMVSLGPIHHGKEEYQLGERYKLALTYEFVNGSGMVIKDLYKKIEDKIKELRECFEEEVTKAYDDEALAWLLFVDGCAILQFIYCANYDGFKDLNIKPDFVRFVHQDLFFLENQLPYRLLKWLMGLSKMEIELRVSIETFFARHCMVPDDQQLKQEQMDEEPVHLLDHLRTKLLGKAQLKSYIIRKSTVPDWQSNRNISYRNIQELKAAGIRLKRSDNSCLRNIRFSKQILLFGHLYLPPIIVDDSTRPKFLNLIAYEMSVDFENDFGITSYIAFLNSLISEANDVKDLSKAGVLFNFLGSDEELVGLFNEIGTDLANPYIYLTVKLQIQRYRESLLSWICRFYHDHFGGTWSIAGFLGAALALSLSGIQAWFTVNPASQRHG